MLAELSTKEISESRNPETFGEHMQVARLGGEIARNARMEGDGRWIHVSYVPSDLRCQVIG